MLCCVVLAVCVLSEEGFLKKPKHVADNCFN